MMKSMTEDANLQRRGRDNKEHDSGAAASGTSESRARMRRTELAGNFGALGRQPQMQWFVYLGSE